MTSARWAAERAVAHCPDTAACVAIAEDTATVHLRWAANTVISNGSVHGRRLTVIAVVGAGVGVVTQQGGLTEEAIGQLTRAAVDTARRARPAPDAQPLAPATGRSPAGWCRPSAGLAFDRFDSFLPALAEAFARAGRRRRLLYGYAEQQLRSTYLASSTGLRRRHVQPSAVVDLTARTLDHGASAWVGASLANLATAELDAMAAQVHERLDWAGRRVADLPVGRYEVLLPPSAVADLMLHLYQVASAGDALNGHTVFSAGSGTTRIGDQLVGAPLTLYGDPAETGLECVPFVVARTSDATGSVFDNGLPLRRTNWLTDGVLTALVQTRQSARLTGQPHTPYLDNLVLTGGEPDDEPGPGLAELIGNTRRGLLVTSLWYLRDVDPHTLLLTGVTRDGVYLVERGEVVGVVPNFRFNESPVALLDRVTEIGRTERTLPREWGDGFTRLAMPPLRVADFAMSARSGSS